MSILWSISELFLLYLEYNVKCSIHFYSDLHQGVRIVLLHGDITTLEVDAIVNSADHKLMHRHGVAKAILDAGKHKFFHKLFSNTCMKLESNIKEMIHFTFFKLVLYPMSD